MKKFFSDFGAFVAKGNALDLAVGLVIGTAFNAIVKSLVSDIIMPFISLIGGKDISTWFWVMRGTATFDQTAGSYIYSADAVILYYGKFIQSIIDFFIIALAIFVALKAITYFRKRIDDAKEALQDRFNDEENVKTE